MSVHTQQCFGERGQIALSRADGHNWSAIARLLDNLASPPPGKFPAAMTEGGYQPVGAEGCYLMRRQRPGNRQAR